MTEKKLKMLASAWIKDGSLLQEILSELKELKEGKEIEHFFSCKTDLDFCIIANEVLSQLD
jgi:hypothetical protein